MWGLCSRITAHAVVDNVQRGAFSLSKPKPQPAVLWQCKDSFESLWKSIESRGNLSPSGKMWPCGFHSATKEVLGLFERMAPQQKLRNGFIPVIHRRGHADTTFLQCNRAHLRRQRMSSLMTHMMSFVAVTGQIDFQSALCASDPDHHVLRTWILVISSCGVVWNPVYWIKPRTRKIDAAV
jgi:hypothetical protein